ncbi:hypothetical protein JDV02_007301 [Purpureocillium takamizusanense]|uniref:Peptidase S9 prolyl oligopeptidase catalytic domain-containing protein n=1 Tax=Purpureocillium takamizusanense TaxID=2060973 RepID=A0A9Q8QKJ7_9HYPO|nr:uncharacterized protein JDV02_007301 [Purpureocillium takamizusanense]UNI21300.1 hypothetical protein JDV02_007301 [Purpureocillium takamizusanense]
MTTTVLTRHSDSILPFSPTITHFCKHGSSARPWRLCYTMIWRIVVALLLLSFTAPPPVVLAVSPIRAYNVDPSSVSVSGLSSGGFMAAQLGVASSDVFKTGFGVFAGGPYDCARNQTFTMCVGNQTPSITIPTANMRAWSSSKAIASVENLASRRIFMQVGTADSTVGVNPMKQLRAQLSAFVDDPAHQVSFVTLDGAAHVFPTDFDGEGDNSCGESAEPWISNCRYDGAGAVLGWMYGGNLTARNEGSPTGTTVSFDQTGEFGARGLDSTGYLYVPSACQRGGSNNNQVCRLHVALHGCLQSHSQIGSKFMDNTGYKKWADTNNIIILFPQAKVDNSQHIIWNGIPIPNASACWDWVGWYGADADQRGGTEMAAIVNQVRAIVRGFDG